MGPEGTFGFFDKECASHRREQTPRGRKVGLWSQHQPVQRCGFRCQHRKGVTWTIEVSAAPIQAGVAGRDIQYKSIMFLVFIPRLLFSPLKETTKGNGTQTDTHHFPKMSIRAEAIVPPDGHGDFAIILCLLGSHSKRSIHAKKGFPLSRFPCLG